MDTRPMHYFSILIFLFCFANFHCQKPQYLWTKALHGSGNESVHGLHTDLNGNVYFGGEFQGTADLDPGPGVINVTAQTNSNVVFLCKANPAGQLIWARWIHVSSGYLSSICTDNSGNVYTGGRFVHQADFDPSTATFNLTGPVNGDFTQFLWKLDNNGNFVTAGAFGGGNGTAWPVVKFNGQQNLYCASELQSVQDLDPGPGVSTYTSAWPGINACFLMLDMNLNLQWAGQFKSSAHSRIYDFEFDQAKNILMSLWVGGTGTLDIDPGSAVYPFTYSGFGDPLILKIAPAGNLIWHQSFSVANGNSRLMLDHLELDAAQHIFLAGHASGTVDIDPGSSSQIMMTYPYPGVKPIVIRLDATGSFVSYDSLGVFLKAFKVNRDTLFFAGGFTGTPDFDPSSSIYTIASQGSGDCYMFSLDNSYNLQWVQTFGGVNSEVINNMVFSNSHEIYVNGDFSGTADFDPTSSSNTITAQAGNDGFISKFSPCAEMPFNGSANSVCAGQSATLTSLNSSSVTWYQNSTGGTAVGTGSVYTTPALSAGSVTYFAVSASCSLMPRTAFVTLVNALPTMTVAGPTKTICPGQSVVLTASGVQSFTWTGGPVNSTYSVSPLQTTSYTVVGENTVTSCRNTSNITVTVSTCSDLDEHSFTLVRVFPNPSDGNLTVLATHSESPVLTDAWGRTLCRLELIEGINKVDFSRFPRGIYFLSSYGHKAIPIMIIR